ncbi:hypothetical protein [Longirhabdus pacifica]|uniref:hypothetical protein n=1 Tax=Longirhabdus pacifica TaxID=2305227 RepID=UPI001008BD19|nr:hypothetical protein [Longirhabdus pacifica]
MTEQGQHQQKLQHALEICEHSIQEGQQAEQFLHEAFTTSDPKMQHSAKDKVKHAKHSIEKAQETLQQSIDEQQQQQVKSMMDSLQQVHDNLNELNAELPKQIR